jgi:hypothetical protein
MLDEYQRDYVREQSVGEIIRNTFDIYKNFFSNIFLPCLLIIGFPTILWSYLGVHLFDWREEPDNSIHSFALSFTGATDSIHLSIFLFTTMLATAVITVVVSEICLGKYPKFGEAIGLISPKRWGKLFVTNILYYLLAGLLLYGLVQSGALDWIYDLLIRVFRGVPRVIFIFFIAPLILRMLTLMSSIMFMFSPAIVVLEGRWGFSAFKRSVTLGWKYHLRNYGAQLVLLFLTYMITMMAYILALFLARRMQSIYGATILSIIMVIIQLIFTPLNIICLVLLYYDMRVRKEAYNNTALALELRH